jgi:hypothetical protein
MSNLANFTRVRSRWELSFDMAEVPLLESDDFITHSGFSCALSKVRAGVLLFEQAWMNRSPKRR